MIDTTIHKSLLLFGFTTVSVYLILKRAKRIFNQNAQQGVLRLIIYPCTGIEVKQLEITPTGVRHNNYHDRAFMLLNEHNNMVTQRTKPSLSLIRPSFDGDEIVLNAPGMEQLRLSNSVDLSSNEIIDFKLWNQPAQGAVYSQKANQWFSRYLKSDTLLVKFLPDSMPYRKTDMHTDTKLVLNSDYPLVYQDECAVALANQCSIDDLNSRLPKENHVSYRNFRPNILVRAGQAFAEDNWKHFSIGEVKFSLAKPGHRCTTTVVMPDRGEKNAAFEPLQTLRSYRVKEEWKHLYKNSPLFGLALCAQNNGFIKFGDQVI